jgi:hypothetical protein
MAQTSDRIVFGIVGLIYYEIQNKIAEHSAPRSHILEN